MSHSSHSLRLAAVAGLLCAAAACADAPNSIVGTEPEHSVLFAMAQESVEEANRLYQIADTAAAAGQHNRAALLWAAIDGLQYGAPMHDIVVSLDGTPESFTAILLEDDLSEGGAHLALARSVVAWSGTSADRIIVAYAQVDGPGSNAVLFLDGDDSMYIGSGEALSVGRSALGAGCVYEQRTPLVGPPGTCTHATLAASGTLSVALGAESRTIQFLTGDLAGVRVSRALEDF